MHKHFFFVIIGLFLSSCNGQSINPGFTAIPKMIKTKGTAPFANVGCSMQDRDGNIWFGTAGEGLYRYDGLSFTNFTDKQGLNDNSVGSVFEDRAGQLWVGTDRGLCRYNKNSKPGDSVFFSRLESKDAPGWLMIFCMLQDKAGNIWFGTTQGVLRYDGDSFTNYLNDRGNTQVVIDIMQDRAGNIWFCSWSRGAVWRYDGKEFTQIVPSSGGLTDDMVFCVMEDRAGRIWFGTRNHGVCRYDGTAFTNVTANSALNKSAVYSIVEDKHGNIWMATESLGVWRYDANSKAVTGQYQPMGKDVIGITNFTTKDGLTNNSVFSILEDKNGNLWFGTRGVGLCRYDGRTFTRFTE